MPYNSRADIVSLLAERYYTKSNLGGFRTQHQASYVSSHTEELWYNEIVCLWMTIYEYIYIKHNRHFMSTYFLLDPFEFPYYFYRIRGELIYVLSIVVCIPSTFCPTLGHHQGRNTIKVIREFERIQKKICRHKMSIMFNEICINEEMLPKYTYFKLHEYIYVYIYARIYMYTYVYICNPYVCKIMFTSIY